MDYKSCHFMSQTGVLQFTLKNDLLFKLVFLNNRGPLKSLLSALLHLHAADIQDIDVIDTNLHGDTVEGKGCVLDLFITLNKNRNINLELQVVRQSDWISRSIYYLCRMHGKLERGGKYRDAIPTLHIGIIDFDLDYEDGKKRTAFYSEYELMDKKTYEIYSSQIGINVLNLKYLENATGEQRDNGLYDWARLFNATTWEELKNMADISEDFTTVAEEVYNHSVDEKTRIMLIKHDMYIRDQLSREAHEREALQRSAELERKNTELKQQHTELEQQNTELEQQNTELKQQHTELEQQNTELKQQHTELEQQIKGRDQQINHLQDEIAALKAQLEAMK